MEPLRKCRSAKFWQPVAGGQWSPIMRDPACSRCPISLAAAPVPANTICPACGCKRATLFDLKTEELKVPDMCMVSHKPEASRPAGKPAGKQARVQLARAGHGVPTSLSTFAIRVTGLTWRLPILCLCITPMDCHTFYMVSFRLVPCLLQEDFVTVLGRTKATVAARELVRFEEFTKEFGSSGE